MKPCVLSIVLVLVSVAACRSPDYGRVPITLSPKAEGCFRTYLEREYPLYFAVSQDGEVCGYTYCPTFKCNWTDLSLALSSCARKNGGDPCKVYAVGRSVVWEGGPAPAATGPAHVPSRAVELVPCRLKDGTVIGEDEKRCKAVGGEVVPEVRGAPAHH